MMKEAIISVEREWFICDASAGDQLYPQLENFLSFYIRLHEMDIILKTLVL